MSLSLIALSAVTHCTLQREKQAAQFLSESGRPGQVDEEVDRTVRLGQHQARRVGSQEMLACLRMWLGVLGTIYLHPRWCRWRETTMNVLTSATSRTSDEERAAGAVSPGDRPLQSERQWWRWGDGDDWQWTRVKGITIVKILLFYDVVRNVVHRINDGMLFFVLGLWEER